MPDSRRTTGLLLLAAVALALRLATVAVLWTEHRAAIAYEHGAIAENLLAGRGFSIVFLGVEGPTSQQAPFYPLLLAGSYAALGPGSDAAHLAVQMVQCVAGTLLVLAVVWLAWTYFPDQPRVGWCAGVLAAVYPTHLYMVTHLQVALWAALVLTLLCGMAASRRWHRSARGAATAGLLCGALLLIEPILALALPILALAYLQRDRELHGQPVRAAGRVLVMAIVAAAVIAPWLWRNYRVHGEFVFVKSTFGYAFWQGNNASSWGTDKIPKPTAESLRQAHDGTLAGIDRAMWDARHETLYIDDVLLKPHGYAEFAGLNEPARARRLGERAWQFIREQPGAYLRLCGQRMRYFLLWDETNPKAANPVYRVSSVAWLALSVLGLTAIPRQRWRYVWPSVAIVGTVGAFHILTITSARFRIPLEPLTFTWAALILLPACARFLPASREARFAQPPAGDFSPRSCQKATV